MTTLPRERSRAQAQIASIFEPAPEQQSLAQRNAWHTGLLGAALNAAGFTEPNDRELLRALWTISHGRPRFTASNAAVASECGMSVDWVDANMPALIERQAELELPLIVRVRRGQQGISSEWDSTLLAQFLLAFTSRKPKVRERAEVGAAVAAELRETPRARTLMQSIKRQVERRAERQAEASARPRPTAHQSAVTASERTVARLRAGIEAEGGSAADELRALIEVARPILARMQEIENSAENGLSPLPSTPLTGNFPAIEPESPGLLILGIVGGGEVAGSHEPEVGEALAAVATFELAGAESFTWALIAEDVKAEGSPHYVRGHSGKGRRLTADELRQALPALIEATYLHPWSLFVRPIGPLAQLDDCPEGIELPGAFIRIETSAGSAQVWLSVADVDARTARRIGRMIAARIGADPAASGSTRWPGSRNGKPERQGATVRAYAVPDAQPVTVSELIDCGLVEPAPQPSGGHDPSVPEREHAPCSRRGWPDYPECLTYHNGNTFAADGRWTWLALDRGHEPDDVADQLLLVREKHDHKGGAAYARASVAAVLEAMQRRAGTG